MLFLSRRHQIHQDLPCRIPAPQKQMPQIPNMLHLPVILHIPLFKILQNAQQNLVHVLMYQHAVSCCQHIISTSFLVTPQRQRAVLILIPKGKLHFIPIPELLRAGLNPFIVIRLLHHRIQKLFHLPGFHFQLFFIPHSLIHTAPACRKNTTYRFPCFQGRLFQNLQKPAFRVPLFKLIHYKPYLLSGHSVFYSDIPFLFRDPHQPLIWKFYFFYYAFKYLSFFHHLLLNHSIHKNGQGAVFPPHPVHGLVRLPDYTWSSSLK